MCPVIPHPSRRCTPGVLADLHVCASCLQYQICRIVTLSAIKTIALSVLFITTVMCIVPRLMTLAAKVCCLHVLVLTCTTVCWTCAVLCMALHVQHVLT
jgi:hypothetical protein